LWIPATWGHSTMDEIDKTAQNFASIHRLN
jgi:hypothetical protein